jgi:hypothetical protein
MTSFQVAQMRADFCNRQPTHARGWTPMKYHDTSGWGDGPFAGVFIVRRRWFEAVIADLYAAHVSKTRRTK